MTAEAQPEEPAQEPADSKKEGEQAEAKEETKPAAVELDTAMVLRRWFSRWRRDLPTFFMKVEYEKQFGAPMPDSLEEWYGEGKRITPADMEVILNWLSEDRRESYKNPSGTKYLAEWLLKWKLFSARARDIGFDKKDETKAVLRWAWKLQVVNNYVEKKLLPKAEKGIAMYTAMCVFAYWDKRGTPGVMPDSTDLEEAIKEQRSLKVGVALDEIISSMRARTGVEFLQSDWKDDKGGDAAVMMAEADSLPGTGRGVADRWQYRPADTTLVRYGGHELYGRRRVHQAFDVGTAMEHAADD